MLGTHIPSIIFYKKQVFLAVLSQKKAIFRAGHLRLFLSKKIFWTPQKYRKRPALAQKLTAELGTWGFLALYLNKLSTLSFSINHFLQKAGQHTHTLTSSLSLASLRPLLASLSCSLRRPPLCPTSLSSSFIWRMKKSRKSWGQVEKLEEK